MVVADDVLRQRSSTQPVPVAGYRNQDMREYAEQVIDDMGGLPYRRASRNQAHGTTGTRTSRVYRQCGSTLAPDTSQDDQIEQHYVQSYRPRRQFHPLVWFGLGMMVVLAVWAGALWVYSTWTLNVSDRWMYGPDHTTVMTGVFSHNKDSAEQPTRLQAFLLNGTVEVVEIPAGDASQGHIYIGPRFVGRQGTVSQTVLVFASKDVNSDGKLDVTVTVYGSSFGWDFQRQSLTTFTLINTGDSFKPQQGG